MHLIDNPWFYFLAVPAVLIAGISKGGFAGGLGVLAVPMMALIISPLQAAAIMLPILCVMDLVGLWSWRDRWDRRLMAIMLPGAVCGIIIGALLFNQLNDGMVKFMIGLLALVFSLNYWLKGKLHALWHLPEPASGWFWGGLSGFTSFISHAGGPPAMIYLLPKHLDKAILVGTLTVMFTVINYVKLVPYTLLGQFNTVNLATALVLSPLAPIGVKLGIWLHGHIEEKLFYRLSYAFLLITGLKLTWDGLHGFI